MNYFAYKNINSFVCSSLFTFMCLFLALDNARAEEFDILKLSQLTWTQVSSVTGDIEGDGGIENIVLYRSTNPINYGDYVSGNGSYANYNLKIVIQRNGETAYERQGPSNLVHEFDPSHFIFSSAKLELQDVTGDGVPEILFSSSSRTQEAVSDLHVIHFDARKKTFEDIRQKSFVTGSDWGPGAVRWLKINRSGVPVGLAVASEGFNISDCVVVDFKGCAIKSDKKFIYGIYAWDGNKFIKTELYFKSPSFRPAVGEEHIDLDLPSIEDFVNSHTSGI